MEIKSKNFCIVLSSPSGAGKTSISKRLLQKDRKLALSISCTTRPRRKGEVNKKDYIFISDEYFKKQIKKGKFLEQASVFGYRYGTLAQTVNNFFKKKRDVLFRKSGSALYYRRQAALVKCCGAPPRGAHP